MRHVPRHMNIFARKMLKVSRLKNVKGFAKLCIPNAIKVALVNCHRLLGTHHLRISHNTPCLPPKIFVYPLFSISTGYYSRPRRN